MAYSLKKPILVSGIGLSIGWWIWQGIQESVGEFGFGSAGLIALGTGLWYWQSRDRALVEIPLITPLSPEKVTAAIKSTETILSQLATEAPQRDLTQLQQDINKLEDSLNRKELQVTITGSKRAGKTQLLQLLTSQTFPQVQQWREATPISSIDLVLFLVSGDLTDSELKTIEQLHRQHHRILLIFNQQDRYSPEEQATLTVQLQQRLEAILAKEDIIPIAAAPAPIKVRQHQEDGSIKEWLEHTTAEIKPLCERLERLLAQETVSLVQSTTWREAIALKNQVKDILNEVKRDRALPIIEQYQWISSATAFANPVAALDLLATVAINGQMIVDLGQVYEQKISLSQAKTSAQAIGKLMVQLGLVELSTQAIGGILKSNVLTYVVGGTVQGVSAAYLTRIAGLTLVAYFQEQDPTASASGFNLDSLKDKLQKVFQENQRLPFLQSFVGQASRQVASYK